MLTVLYRDHYGNETIREALEVRRTHGVAGQPAIPVCGVLANLPDGGTWLLEERAPDDDRTAPVVYVMNGSGKTVATYTL